jgi:hypothetical protein
VRQPKTNHIRVPELKTAAAYDGHVAVGGKDDDVVVEFSFGAEGEARVAQMRAEAAAPNALCTVEAYPLPARLTQDS